MKRKKTVAGGSSKVITAGDSSKLLSLLALAAGAAAMPQTGKADIVYTNLTSNPVQIGFAGGYSSSYTFSNLPGTAQFGFQAYQHSTTTFGTFGSGIQSYRTITVGRRGGTVPAGVEGAGNLAAHFAYGAAWDQGLGLYSNIAVGEAVFFGHAPDSYSQEYMPFTFYDTSQGGIQLYGWILIDFSNGNLTASTGPAVTIYGYAYDNSGVQIPMGAMPVPEPAPMGILALGALALGANGVRAWRRNRTAGQES